MAAVLGGTDTGMKPKEDIIITFKFNIKFFKVEEVPHIWMMSTVGLVWKTLKS